MIVTITKEVVDQYLSYDPCSGLFRWKCRDERHPSYNFRTRGWNTVFAGKVAGKLHTSGYIYISIRRKLYLAHRLAWLTTYGFLPDEVDHENHIRSDNRISNLRGVDNFANAQNITKPSDNTSGFVGVYWHKGAQKWMAQIRENKRIHYLGLFHSKEDALRRRKDAEVEFGFHPNHGAPANDNNKLVETA